MREREIRCVIEDDDETNKQAKAKLKNKEKQKRRSFQAALSIVDDQNSFNETLDDANLVSASNLVTRRFETLRIKNVLQKKCLIVLIKLCNLILLNIGYMKLVIGVSCIYLMSHYQWKSPLHTSSDKLF